METDYNSEIVVENELIVLSDKDITLELSPIGEIVGLKKGAIQILHGGGKDDKFKEGTDSLGWKRSEILMFPIVGPARDYVLYVDDCETLKEVAMDQHGISRYIPFRIASISRKSISLIQEYVSDTQIINLKYSKTEDNGHPETISWPYSFSIEKNISLHSIKNHDDFAGYSGFVDIEFHITNKSENIMPFMFGFHPAFRTYGNEGNIIIEHGDSAKDIPFDGFLGKDITLFNRNTGDIFFRNSKIHFRMHHTFGNTMVWSPKGAAEIICIEPVTCLPKTLENAEYRLQVPKFEFLLPGKTKTYNARIFL